MGLTTTFDDTILKISSNNFIQAVLFKKHPRHLSIQCIILPILSSLDCGLKG